MHQKTKHTAYKRGRKLNIHWKKGEKLNIQKKEKGRREQKTYTKLNAEQSFLALFNTHTQNIYTYGIYTYTEYIYTENIHTHIYIQDMHVHTKYSDCFERKRFNIYARFTFSLCVCLISTSPARKRENRERAGGRG